jgi:hypothetical protein
LLLVDAYARRKRAQEATEILEALIAQHKADGLPVPASWYDRGAALAYGQKSWSQMARFYAGRLSLQPAPADWRTATAVYIAGAAPDKEAVLDLMRLQSATGALASERDVQAYAALAAAQGYPAEARAVIEAGRKNGKLLATDPASTGLLASLTPKTTKKLSATKNRTPASAGSAGARSLIMPDSMLANAQFAQAVPLYQAALSAGGVDADRVNTRLGIALARSGDLAGAQDAFARAKGQWGDVALFWSAWAKGQQARLGQ